jgi:hypothetical protein
MSRINEAAAEETTSLLASAPGGQDLLKWFAGLPTLATQRSSL